MEADHPERIESQCSIQDLSFELVLMIMDLLPFSAQYNLACTSKRLAFASRGLLERHQDSHKKYRTASDLEPSTVPLLLRSAFKHGDPIPAWHVQAFEVWKDRTTWSEWQEFDLYMPLVVGSDCKPSHSRVSKEEARCYLDWFEKQVGEVIDNEVMEQLLTRIESGHDGLLKALLFAKLERLKDLKFVTRSQKAGSCLTSLKTLIAECIKKQTSNDNRNKAAKRNRCEDCSAVRDNDSKGIEEQDSKSDWDLELITLGKCSLHSRPSASPWPSGLSGIRRVAVGVASGTWMDDNRDEEPCDFLFHHLLRLPSLYSIYFNRLCAWKEDRDWEHDPEEEECTYNIYLRGSSSVRHIFLHGSSGGFGYDEDVLWEAPKALLTASFRFDGPEEYDGATATANSLARAQKHSLQSLMWYGYKGNYSSRNILGDHCSILDNEEFDHFKRLPAVKQVSYSVHDIELCMEHAYGYQCLRHDSESGRDDDDDQGDIYDEDDEDEFFVRRVATMFPRTIETVVLWDSPDEERALRLMERGIVKMIQSGRYKNLKGISLEATERATDRSLGVNFRYEDAVAAGFAAGVDVRSLSNQKGMQHSVEFAEAPDEYDLTSGIHSGARPSSWVFDSYLGRRISPSCKVERYDKLWDSLDSEIEAYRSAMTDIEH